MIDNFALALSHGLIILAAWRLMFRDDLNDDSVPEPVPPAKPDRKIKLKREGKPRA